MQNIFKSFAKSVRMLYNSKATVWRDVRAVECARLESGYALTGIAGSNPVLSAKMPILCNLFA